MTRNLFHEKWTAAELETLLRHHPRVPLLPGFGSEAWTRTGQNPEVVRLAQPMRKRALAEADEPLPVLTEELYASFALTGIRLTFERVYFERRRHLARAAASLLLGGPKDPDRAVLTASLLNKFTDVFDEVSWSLPAHVNWGSGDKSGKEPMRIDLFCAETANMMAEILDLFGDLIPTELQARVRQRLMSHIFENYIARFEQMGWTKVTHNWNAVCHQGVLGAALSQLDDPAMLARMLLLARDSLQLFLGGFTKDGGCTEGIGYWSYGFGWFVMLNEQLETRTGGELSLFEGDEHVRRIAQFGPAMALSAGKLVNFSDNGAEGKLNPAVVHYLAGRLDEPGCRLAANEFYRQTIEEGLRLDDQRCDIFLLGRLLLWCPESCPAPAKELPADCFLPDLAVVVARGIDEHGHLWEFAAKAGNNDEHHNHNDCGSFLLNIDGLRLLAEIGAPEYTRDFFSAKRYQFIATRSMGHPVPLINGQEQREGAAFTSQVVEHQLRDKVVEFVIDATAAYPAEAGLRACLRSFLFEKAPGRLTVRDLIELNQPGVVEGALISVLPITIENEAGVIRTDKQTLMLRPLPGARVDRVEIHPYRAHRGGDATAYRLVLRPEATGSACAIGVEITLA